MISFSTHGQSLLLSKNKHTIKKKTIVKWKDAWWNGHYLTAHHTHQTLLLIQESYTPSNICPNRPVNRRRERRMLWTTPWHSWSMQQMWNNHTYRRLYRKSKKKNNNTPRTWNKSWANSVPETSTTMKNVFVEFNMINGLIIIETWFPLPEFHKTVWVSPDWKTRNQLQHSKEGKRSLRKTRL